MPAISINNRPETLVKLQTVLKGLSGIDVEASNGFWQSEAAQIYAMATSEQTTIANA